MVSKDRHFAPSNHNMQIRVTNKSVRNALKNGFINGFYCAIFMLAVMYVFYFYSFYYCVLMYDVHIK